MRLVGGGPIVCARRSGCEAAGCSTKFVRTVSQQQPLTPPQVHDAAAALEAIHESHLGQLLPRVRQCDGLVTDFLGRCTTAKSAMGKDVLEQLQVRGCGTGHWGASGDG